MALSIVLTGAYPLPMLLFLLACSPGDSKNNPPSEELPAQLLGQILLAGGGSEGEIGEEEAWSAPLYRGLLRNGDINGDGRIQVAVLSVEEESSFIPDYFVWLGADGAENHMLPSREAAEGVDFAAVDAVFIKGGDQGIYYDTWNNTALEAELRRIHGAGGGVGGTSAGAMSMAGYTFAGGEDLISMDVLTDARTSYLDDRDGGSGIHDDFFGFLPGWVVDTHFTSRARLGRLAGILARVVEDDAPPELLGIGIEERTGVIFEGNRLEVWGEGSVSILGVQPDPRREAGLPLVWTELPLDRLVEGWRWEEGEVIPREEAEAVSNLQAPVPLEGEWAVSGSRALGAENFAWVAQEPDGQLREGNAQLRLTPAIAMMDAQNDDLRGVKEELLLRGLIERPGASGWLLPWESGLEQDPENPERLVNTGEAAVLVVDTRGLSWRDVGPRPAPVGQGSLYPAAFAGAQLHLLHGSTGWDTRQALPAPQ